MQDNGCQLNTCNYHIVLLVRFACKIMRADRSRISKETSLRFENLSPVEFSCKVYLDVDIQKPGKRSKVHTVAVYFYKPKLL